MIEITIIKTSTTKQLGKIIAKDKNEKDAILSLNDWQLTSKVNNWQIIAEEEEDLQFIGAVEVKQQTK